MTYLYFLLPPIVIVISTALILYLLSRKSLDLESPDSSAGVGKDEKFSSVKQGLFNFLEKSAHFFKSLFLGLHNKIEKWLKETKKKKMAVAESRKNETIIFEEADEEGAEKRVFEGEDSSGGVNSRAHRRSPKAMIQKSLKRLDFSRNISRMSGMSKNKIKEEIQDNTEVVEEREVRESFQKKKDIPMISDEVVYPEKKDERRENKKLERMLVERIAQDPRDIEAYERLGVYYEEIANIEDALACFKHVLKLSHGNERAEKKIAKLESLMK